MARKKQEEVKQGLPEWQATFSDMMTLLMCFFVMLFSMSSIDAAKFDEVAQSFQQTISIFKGGAQAIGDGILISNGVSQLNQLDEFFNTTGKVAQSNTDELDFKENAQGMKELAEKLEVTSKEVVTFKDGEKPNGLASEALGYVAYEGNIPVIENSYKTEPVKALFEVEKTLLGKNFKSGEAIGFSFKLSPKTEGAPMAEGLMEDTLTLEFNAAQSEKAGPLVQNC